MAPLPITDDALPPSGISWKTWLYVLGEMPVEDTEAFELRLEQDLTLSLEVARCVQMLGGLSQATQSVSTPVVSSQTPARIRPLNSSLTPVLLAFSLACITVGTLLWSGASSSPRSTTAPSRLVTQLVQGWRDSSQDVRPTLASDLDESSPFVDLESTDVPSWMIAAVSLELKNSHPNVSDDADDWETN